MTGNGYSIGNDDVAVERELPVKLTEPELLARGDSMAAAELEIDRLKAERRELNGRIRTHVDERNKLAHTIESEQEMRKVVCKWISDFDHNVWRLVRQDTGDEVETRAMTAGDRQASLPIDGGAEPTLGAVEVVELDGDGDADEEVEVEVDGDVEVPERAAKAKAKGKSKKTKGSKAKSQRAYA